MENPGVKLFTKRRELKVKDRMNVVLLFHGSLVDFSSKLMTIAAVARRLNMPYQTV